MPISIHLPEIDRLRAELAAANRREASMKASNREEAKALQELQSARRQIEGMRADISRLENEKVAHGKAELARGYLIACCNVANLHNMHDVASDVLIEMPITQTEVNAMDLSDYDAKALAEIRAARADDPIKAE